MSPSPPLIIKVFLVLSFLFVSSSAQFLWGFPFNPIQEREQEQEQEKENNEENEDAATHAGISLPGLPKLPQFPSFENGKDQDQEDSPEENGDVETKPKPEQPKPLPQQPAQPKQPQPLPEKPKPLLQKPKQPEQPKKPQPLPQKPKPLPQQPKQLKQPKKPQPLPEKPKPLPQQPKQPVQPKKPQPSPEKPKPLPQQPKQKQPKQPKPLPEKPKPLPEQPSVGQAKTQPKPEQPKPLPREEATIGLGLETKFAGKWEIASINSGVSAMHLQLLPTNKVAMFDATSLGKSDIELPHNRCRLVPNTTNVFDCYAHAVEYDLLTNKVKTLKVLTNPWCSSGGLDPDGTLISTGGWEEGEKSIRYYTSCPTCDWRESKIKLADIRWYGTQAQLADGRYILLGGRRAFNYEFLAPENKPSPGRIELPFLLETTDLHENNLYPFIHLAPDGNLFVLANNRSILLDVRTNKILRKYPDLPGGARNYPGSATSAILPINLQNGEDNIDIEVLVCGGGQPLAFGKADKEGIFLPALDTCGRIKVLDPKANWEMEIMPEGRVMSDMLNLPNGEIIILNGAKKGASGWQFADEPIFTPYLYSPNKPHGYRIRALAPTTIARMYHSSSAVLPEGKILVAGSNTNPGYKFAGVKFPTELRVEKFSPPYLDPTLQKHQPKVVNQVKKNIGYGETIEIAVSIAAGDVQQKDIMVTMYKPPFTTHGYSMNQRLLVLKMVGFQQGGGTAKLQVQVPAKGEIAPPGYYLVFVNCHGVPSVGSWVQLK